MAFRFDGGVIMYEIYYYDSWSDTYERSSSFDTLSEAEREVSRRIKSHEPDVTAYYIEWREDGIPYEIGYYLTLDGWERD